MKKTALLSSIAALIIFLVALLVYSQIQPAAPNATAKKRPVTMQKIAHNPLSIDNLRPEPKAIKKDHLRARTREVLKDDGTIVAIAQVDVAKNSKKKPSEQVLDLLREREVKKGYTNQDFSEAILSNQFISKHNGVTHVYLRQRINGIEVYNGDANANIARDGTVLSLHNRFVPDLRSEINRENPVITAEKAILIAAKDLGSLSIDRSLTVKQNPKGPALESVFEGGKISLDPIPARLMYLPQANEITRLVWNVVLHQPIGSKWMDVNIDAETGAVLSRANWYSHADYNVYPLPFETPIDGDRQVVTDPHDAVASPFGWHDTNGAAGAEFTDTRGNNVNAQDDTDDNNTGGTRPDGGAGLSFDQPIDLSQEPSAYLEGATTNLFYWNNILHDIFYRYGFDEASGNFQENNYGRGGAGSDPVEADAQDGSGTNNANFSTPPDGFNPRMQMFIWTGPNPDRDSDLDNVIIVHEYGHGVSNRLTGGASNSSALSGTQSGGMGEGWSDWLGLVVTAKPNQLSDLSRTVGYYVLGQGTNGGGIRPRPYTTDMSVNEITYGEISTGSLTVPHGVGFVWCSALWEMYWNLVDQHGYDSDIYTGTGGNNIALQLVMDGLKLQPANPTFLEARDAILLADEVNNGGANSDFIWAAFAKRGIGFSATDSGDPNDLDVVEAFDIPDERFSITDVTVTETDNTSVNATFTVTLSPAAIEQTTVDFATVNGTAAAPSDYTATSGTLEFAIGESTKTITVSVLADNLAEDDEIFTVQLSNPVNGSILDGEGVATILTDDFSIPVISSSLSTSGFIGNPITYQITADNAARSFSLSGTPPTGMVVDSVTGVLTWTPSEIGVFEVQISATNPGGTDTRTLSINVLEDPLQVALDINTPLTSSEIEWFFQTEITFDGVDAAQSGDINDSESSWVEFDVEGPDTLSFSWRVSSESNFDFLHLQDNGATITSIHGEQDWQPYLYDVPDGTHTIRFSYNKDSSVSRGSDAGWVDKVTLLSTDPRPIITSQNQATGEVGEAFNYQITTTQPATSFTSSPLPGGLTLNSTTGLISGIPTENAAGASTVDITATNAEGSDSFRLNVNIFSLNALNLALDTTIPLSVSLPLWFAQNSTTQDGIDALQSPDISDNQSAAFELTVTGPQTIEFWWKVSSESNFDFLRFSDDGTTISSISGDIDWQRISHEITAGTHTLRWEYDKDGSVSTGSDAGWVDQISLTTGIAQTIDFPEIPDQAVTSSFVLAATGGDSGNPVTYFINSGSAVIGGNQSLSFSDTGDVTVSASQAGSLTYQRAEDVAQSFVVGTAQGLYESAAAAAGLSGDDALPDASPFNGSITNLEKYAFNLDLSSGESGSLTEGGTSGLPILSLVEDEGVRFWRLTFVRLKHAGLTYTPKQSETAAGSFTEISGSEITVVDIDSAWELVEYRDVVNSDQLFLTVEVSF